MISGIRSDHWNPHSARPYRSPDKALGSYGYQSAAKSARRSANTRSPAAHMSTLTVRSSGCPTWPTHRLRRPADARTAMREGGHPSCDPHQFRHSFAHAFLADGGNDTDLTRLAAGRLGGWVPKRGLGRCGEGTAGPCDHSSVKRLWKPGAATASGGRTGRRSRSRCVRRQGI